MCGSSVKSLLKPGAKRNVRRTVRKCNVTPIMITRKTGFHMHAVLSKDKGLRIFSRNPNVKDVDIYGGLRSFADAKK